MSSIVEDVIDEHYRNQPITRTTTVEVAKDNGLDLVALVVYMKQIGVSEVLLELNGGELYNPRVELTMFPNDDLKIRILEEDSEE
jgi:hypothetical protein